MVDVLLTHSYFLKFDPKEYKAMMPYPPLGTLYAGSYLQSKGYSVTLFDSMVANDEFEILPLIDAYKPRIVVIYDDDFNYLTKMCLSRMREAAFTLSRLAKTRGCYVAVHGSDAADHIESYMNNNADFILSGEGEITLGELVDTLLKHEHRNFHSIDGLAFRTEGGIIRKNPKRKALKNLDALPFPARNLIDAERYRKIWKKRHGYFSMNMVTTRGCPFHCNWCAKPIYGQTYHVRSPENVLEEMLFVKENYHPDHIWFCDDIFGLKPGWVPRFAELIKNEGAIIPFKCLARVDLLLKENAVHYLAHAGCQTVWVGAESGSQKILDAMEKETTVEQIYRASTLLHQYGIRVGFFLQFGYPGETREDIELTLQMIKDCRPEEIGVSVSYPLPGTKFYENIQQKMGKKRNWVDSSDLDLMFPGTYTPDFYRALHKVTHKKFTIWRGLNSLKTVAAHPWVLNQKTVRTIGAMAYHALTLPFQKMKLNLIGNRVFH